MEYNKRDGYFFFLAAKYFATDASNLPGKVSHFFRVGFIFYLACIGRDEGRLWPE